MSSLPVDPPYHHICTVSSHVRHPHSEGPGLRDRGLLRTLEGIQKLSNRPPPVLSSRGEFGRREPTTGDDLPMVHTTKSAVVESVQGAYGQPD